MLSNLTTDELWDWLLEDSDRAKKFFDDIRWKEGFHYCTTSSYRYFRETGVYVIANALIQKAIRD